MTQIDINTSLKKIEIFWENISKESDDDPDVYGYIATQTMSLKMTAFHLKDKIEIEILKDKKARLKLQKLQKALENIVNKLDFKIHANKDKEYIESILNKLSKIKEDVEVVRLYK